MTPAGLGAPRDRYVALIRRGRWFGGLPEAEQALVLASLVERRFTRGQIIQSEGSQGLGLAWLVDGTIRIERQVDEHGPTLMLVGQPGFWFGQAAIVSEDGMWVTVAARTAATVLTLARADYQRLAPRVPAFIRAVEGVLLWRSQLMFRFYAEARALAPALLLRVQLATLAEIRADDLGVPATDISLDLTQDELAQLVGMARQQVNPRLKALAGEGLVHLANRRITVVSAAALRGAADTSRPSRRAGTAGPGVA